MRTVPLRLRDGVRRQAPTSLYVHIPFCASRCYYCDFTTYVAPKGAIAAYLDELGREFELLAPQVTHPLQTVFFGGGTPTLPDAQQLADLMARLRSAFPIAADAEITMEANPGTVDADKLETLRAHGVNRLSFGAQTFEPRLLMTIGRLHDTDAIYNSVRRAQQAGFERINLDLMFGLPEQTLDDVRRSLDETLSLGIEHVSAYWLKVEPGTPFADWQARGMLPLPGEDAEGDMYEEVVQTLVRAGYLHYEVSNFARPGGEARHNLVYWRNEPYLAAGVGAHGYVHGERYENVRTLAAYASALADGRRPVADTMRVSVREACEDTMMLGLRLAEGVSRAAFLKRHGVAMDKVFGKQIRELTAQGLLAWTDGRLHLTERAWPIANVVFEAFIDTVSML
ncbi:oxygen-independent coproporphyrinogen III oxidase [Alicyclobacillus cycloheptanicus]|uniref:Heme chaperone HemW n=1 Tax=Alicyclobacillus cycloheptanicus TaxID=1457 RepID=A0ABT9XKB2_9BACL|nr:radical SAM family heme chaperone HemW [Alicyclobacillus cycloheptanicus]MDQ0190489.1 oxygen-independent coproporphyrinogen-3 oxidase [Alicyclobacillus cycloheptanicus]WDM00748.1 oxygen-independent coproporphyrinogen III oxidase [Alicyclobacillus cycloheptanicus]